MTGGRPVDERCTRGARAAHRSWLLTTGMNPGCLRKLFFMQGISGSQTKTDTGIAVRLFLGMPCMKSSQGQKGVDPLVSS